MNSNEEDDEAVRAAERKAKGVRELVRARGNKPKKTADSTDRDGDNEIAAQKDD
jgi:hypothetical protein